MQRVQNVSYRLIRSIQSRRFYGTIRDAGGVMGKKATVEEEKFIHDHEVEVLDKFKKTLKEKEAAAAEAAAKKAAEPEEPHIKINPTGPYGSAKSGALGDKESAAEATYFRKLDNEKINHLKEKK
ncbi:hypothetical protein BC833DRAFT_603341 [Globomyces pollinis-pini]|nr:hypothetical protein BC833DRAFT_603341 [Globomyces pollinis-pini]